MITDREWKEERGRAWADNFAFTDRAFSSLTQTMLERLAGLAGDEIVDIGCGAGELALALGRARPKSQVTGVDISSDLVQAARNRGERRSNVAFELADAAGWTPPQARAPDLLVSRHGVMFFEDPTAAFSHIRKQAAPDAQLFFSCFRNPAENFWSREVANLLELPSPPDPFAPGPFAFADEDRVRSILYRAGWQDATFEAVDFPFVVGLGDEAVAEAIHFYTAIGPASAAFTEMEPDVREEAKGKLRAFLEERCKERIVAFRAAAWLVQAVNSE